jgi:hypothetical protein
MQLYWTSALRGGADHVGLVKLLPLPEGVSSGGSFTPNDPLVLVGHRDVSLRPGTPFVLPVAVWVGERYHPDDGVPDDPELPDYLFTDPPIRNLIIVYIDGKPVMDSTVASLSPFYFGPAPLPLPEDESCQPPPSSSSCGLIYQPARDTGPIAALFVQGIGLVHPPLSVGTHTIELVSELRIPPDPTFLNLSVYPNGVGLRFENTWTITVSPK